MTEVAWDLLFHAVTHRRHPFHTAVLATTSERGPEARSVILRHVDRETWEVGCHVDVRSPKAKEVLADPRVSWLFYSFPDKLQVRCRGIATLHHQDNIAAEMWARTQLLSRRCYLAPLAPSEAADGPVQNIPEHLVGREPTEEESVGGFENFGVLRCKVQEMDILSLEYTGNRRLLARADGSQIWLSP